MARIDPQAARQFAVDVVQRLRRADYEALWAGGCVRDQLLEIPPKDYDVATSATPDEVRTVFGKRRTIAMGASFGVITVLGPKRAGTVEVATFRQDAGYSDGRHPDQVTFAGAREDAFRRDFTINGLFWDPIESQVIDYVGGQRDLANRLVRAIGDPHQRIAEDKLRMLRAVRFAAVFGFQIDPPTLSAICEHAAEISVVSVERISEELRRMLRQPRRRRAVELLRETGLLKMVLPEFAARAFTDDVWFRTLSILDALPQPRFSNAWAVLLRELPAIVDDQTVAAAICRRARLSKREIETTLFCLRHERLVRNAPQQPWCHLQRVLTSPLVGPLLDYAEAVASTCDPSINAIEFCRQKVALPPEVLDPPPLLTGHDLLTAGIPAGPDYRTILEAVRDAQLLGQVRDRREAVGLAKQVWQDLDRAGE